MRLTCAENNMYGGVAEWMKRAIKNWHTVKVMNSKSERDVIIVFSNLVAFWKDQDYKVRTLFEQKR